MHPDGLEPPTYSSVDCRSIQLSYGCFPSRTWTIGHRLVLARLKSEFIQKSVPRLELALPMRLPVRGSDPKFRSICLTPITRLFQKAIPSSRESQNFRAEAQSKDRSLRRRDPVRGQASRPRSLASRLFCFANASGNHRCRRRHPRQPRHPQRHQRQVRPRP
jgi:hypothetical protein